MPSILEAEYALRRFFANLQVDVSNAYRVGEDMAKTDVSKDARNFFRRTQPPTVDAARRAFLADFKSKYGDVSDAYFHMERVMLRYLPQGEFRTDAEAMVGKLIEGAEHGFSRAVEDELYGYGLYLKMIGSGSIR